MNGGLIITDSEIFQIIVDIMEISNEQDDLHALCSWIDEIGIDAVFETIIRLHTIYALE